MSLVETYNGIVNKYSNNKKKHKDRHTKIQACKNKYIEDESDNAGISTTDGNKADIPSIANVADKADNKIDKIGGGSNNTDNTGIGRADLKKADDLNMANITYRNKITNPRTANVIDKADSKSNDISGGSNNSDDLSISKLDINKADNLGMADIIYSEKANNSGIAKKAENVNDKTNKIHRHLNNPDS